MKRTCLETVALRCGSPPSAEGQRTSRRELLGAAGRWGGLAGLLSAGGLLMARARRSRDACESAWPCGECPAFDRCKLSRAAAARKTGKER